MGVPKMHRQGVFHNHLSLRLSPRQTLI